MKNKPLTAKQLFDEEEKRKVVRRKKLSDKILCTIINDHIKSEEEAKEDLIYVFSELINRLTK